MPHATCVASYAAAFCIPVGFNNGEGFFQTCSVISLAFYAFSLLNLLLPLYNWQFIFRIFHICYLSYVIHLFKISSMC